MRINAVAQGVARCDEGLAHIILHCLKEKTGTLARLHVELSSVVHTGASGAGHLMVLCGSGLSSRSYNNSTKSTKYDFHSFDPMPSRRASPDTTGGLPI